MWTGGEGVWEGWGGDGRAVRAAAVSGWQPAAAEHAPAEAPSHLSAGSTSTSPAAALTTTNVWAKDWKHCRPWPPPRAVRRATGQPQAASARAADAALRAPPTSVSSSRSTGFWGRANASISKAAPASWMGGAGARSATPCGGRAVGVGGVGRGAFAGPAGTLARPNPAPNHPNQTHGPNSGVWGWRTSSANRQAADAVAEAAWGGARPLRATAGRAATAVRAVRDERSWADGPPWLPGRRARMAAERGVFGVGFWAVPASFLEAGHAPCCRTCRHAPPRLPHAAAATHTPPRSTHAPHRLPSTLLSAPPTRPTAFQPPVHPPSLSRPRPRATPRSFPRLLPPISRGRRPKT